MNDEPLDPFKNYVLAIVARGESYIFIFDHASCDQVLQTFGRYAANPELTFTWYEAAILSQKVVRIKRDPSAEAA